METLLKVSSKWLLAFLSYIEELKRVIKLRPNPKSFRPTGSLMTVIKLQKVLIQRVCQSSVLITTGGREGWNEPNLIGSKLDKQKYSEGQWEEWSSGTSFLVLFWNQQTCHHCLRLGGESVLGGWGEAAALEENLLALWFHIFNLGWLEDSFIHLTRFFPGCKFPPEIN